MTSPKYCYLDYEYNKTKNKKVSLVCCSLNTSRDPEPKEYWLHCDVSMPAFVKGSYLRNKTIYEILVRDLNELNEQGYIFLSWSVVAEARSFISLGLNPLDFRWIDMFLEYRCIKNHSDDIGFGKQLIDGKKIRTSPNKWAKNYQKGEDGLAAAIYKLLNIVIDTEHKYFIRDLIISAPESFSNEEKGWIQKYCTSDIVYLPKIFEKIVQIYTKRLPKKHQESLKEEMLYRGRYAARTAIMESEGYPYNPQSVKNFANSVSYILDDIAIDINEQFPEEKIFVRKPATRRFSKKEAPQRDWILTTPYSKDWKMTSGGKLGNKQFSLALEAYTKFYNFTHDYPRGNLGAQMVRFLKIKQSLNGFMPKKPNIQYWDQLRSDGEKIIKQKSLKKSKTFFDYTNPKDGRVHPYLNIYGSQASRSQPGATGFIPLKAAWMRALIEPPPGKAVIGLDWGQIQFLLKMLISRDPNGLKAYESGDVYLYFAKEADAVPQDATKESHKLMRDKFKNTTLGIQFAMTKFGLAIKLTEDTKVEHTEDEAQELIDLFEEIYPEAHENGEDILDDYEANGFYKTPDGWYMWGDNPNARSIKNCPFQGWEASIMRKAVELGQDYGFKIIYTLHDAIYLECDSDKAQEIASLMATFMDEAFRFYLPEDQKEIGYCKIDADIWSGDFEDETKKYNLKYSTSYGEYDLPVKQQKVYIDERAQADYDRFSKYFKDIFKTHLL